MHNVLNSLIALFHLKTCLYSPFIVLFMTAEAQAERASALTKTELEWERVRTAGIGTAVGTLPKDTLLASGPSLYDQLKQKEEQSATEEEEKSRGSNLPKMLDEDGTNSRFASQHFPSSLFACLTSDSDLLRSEARFFDEQKIREREEGRRLEMQLDQFKRASALASVTTQPDLPTLPLMIKKSPPSTMAKKFSPLALLANAKKSPQTPSDSASKKRSAEDVQDGSPNTKKPKLEEKEGQTKAENGSLAKPRGLVKYNRIDDE